MTYAPPPYVPPVTTEDPTAVMGRRISAALLDLLLPTAIAIAVGFVLWFGAGTRYPRPLNESGIQQSCGESSVAIGEECATVNNDFVIVSSEDGNRARTVGFLIWLYVPLNVLLVQGVSGATVGKHLVGLRVVREDGSDAGFGRNLVRGLLLLVALALCGVGLIAEFVVMLATNQHRRVGDMAAGTYVVRKTSVGSPVISRMNFNANPYGYAPPPMGMAQPWSAPAPGSPYVAPPQGYGAAPQPTAWGSPAATRAQNSPQPDAGIPASWGIQPEPIAQADGQQTGWASPQATPIEIAPNVAVEEQTATLTSPDQTQSPQAAMPVTQAAPRPEQAADPTQPQWDDARKAYIAWEPTRRSWMQHDAATNEWKPIS